MIKFIFCVLLAITAPGCIYACKHGHDDLLKYKLSRDWRNVAWSLFLLQHSDGGVNNIKAWIKPALYKQLRLLVVV